MQQYVQDKPNKPLIISIDTEIGQLEQFANNWLVAGVVAVAAASLVCNKRTHQKEIFAFTPSLVAQNDDK